MVQYTATKAAIAERKRQDTLVVAKPGSVGEFPCCREVEVNCLCLRQRGTLPAKITHSM